MNNNVSTNKKIDSRITSEITPRRRETRAVYLRRRIAVGAVAATLAVGAGVAAKEIAPHINFVSNPNAIPEGEMPDDELDQMRNEAQATAQENARSRELTDLSVYGAPAIKAEQGLDVNGPVVPIEND